VVAEFGDVLSTAFSALVFLGWTYFIFFSNETTTLAFYASAFVLVLDLFVL
jgi:hypothetical protein